MQASNSSNSIITGDICLYNDSMTHIHVYAYVAEVRSDALSFIQENQL